MRCFVQTEADDDVREVEGKQTVPRLRTFLFKTQIIRRYQTRQSSVTAMLKAIQSQDDKEGAKKKAALVAEKRRGMKLETVAKFAEESVEETLSYMDFPPRALAQDTHQQRPGEEHERDPPTDACRRQLP